MELMKTLGITHSACPVCRSMVPAKVVADEQAVYFRKFCPEHGESECYVRSNPQDYLRTQRFVKPALAQREFHGDSQAPCPEGCGFCDRHEQHLCLPIVEITSRCDLACPVCIADAGGAWDMTIAEFSGILDSLIQVEGQVDVLNLSGGEPLLHPELLGFVDEALSRPEIVRVSISTNGLRLLAEPELVTELRDRDVVVSLQFDGFADEPYRVLRGEPLFARKLEILNLLAEADVATSLTMTVARGVNDDQFPQMLDCLFTHEHILSLMIQPVAFVGRGASLSRRGPRLSIPDVVDALGRAGHSVVRRDDFLPLPCSHPLCFNLAFYLMLESGGAVALNRLVDASTALDSMANRVIFGLDAAEHERMKELVYDLWSGPAASAPDSEAVIRTLRGVLRDMSCTCFDPRKAFTTMERRVKSIFIHAFQDADTFDLARIRRCCQAYPQANGQLIPACAHNVLRRGR
jgi:uncharacterized radical SAM superfamily Fe-S cluster-containing enzyme